ncbi:MAG: cation-efflux pump [Syntrophorhabdales bacterium]|jgi:cation diffusion facilitator family transporter
MTEEKEKKRVTIVSLGAAVVLVFLKLFVGIATGYLTLLSEALHSSLDALITIITFFAIRYAGKPADAGHPYGHSKAENLAAFTESVLLFFAISLILREVVERLFFKSVVIEPNVWAVCVLAASILCDVQRSRALRKIAVKYKSPAIEANAVHFRADFVTSSIAMAGILATYVASRRFAAAGPSLYSMIDIVTTCLVLLIVVRMVLRILLNASGVLLDRTAPQRTALIKDIVAEVPEVIDVENVRTREAGKQTFVDLTVDIDRNLTVERGYSIGQRVEETIKKHIDDADVTLTVKPVASEAEDIVERIRSIGAQAGCNLHHIAVHDVSGTLHVDLDLEVEGDLILASAHALADDLEARIKQDNPAIREINTHIDWRPPSVTGVSIGDDKALARTVEAVVRERKEVISCRKVSIEELGPEGISLTIYCTMRPEEAAAAVREVSQSLEKKLMERIGGLSRVIIHFEPEEKT